MNDDKLDFRVLAPALADALEQAGTPLTEDQKIYVRGFFMGFNANVAHSGAGKVLTNLQKTHYLTRG